MKYRVGNSEKLRTNIKDVNENLPEEYIIASLDVVNMYPNVPTDEKALNVVKEYIIKHWDNINMFGFKVNHVITMLEFIFKNTYIMYGEQYYIQVEGIGTGLHTSGAYAEIIVDYIYTNAVKQSPIKPSGLSCYVDDSLTIWPGNRITFIEFRNLLGTFWQTMKFEEVIDDGSGVPCLDMRFYKDASNKIQHDFYQKPTNSGRYMHYNSHCSMALKVNLVRTEAARVYRCCSIKDGTMWKHIKNYPKTSFHPAIP